MMRKFEFNFDVFHSIDELPEADAILLKGAIEATKNAYAPYSNFHVAAMARLSNGEYISGTNQENASYPVGICAERTLLSAVSAIYPKQPIEAIAITYDNLNGLSDHPITPCGICRQTLVEYETRTHQPIRLILGGMTGEVFVLDTAKNLLPLSFSSDDMTTI